MTSVARATKKIGMVGAINEALDQALAEDDNVILLGEDIGDPEGGGVFGATMGLSAKYGDRVRSTPISEQAIIGAAIGAAMAGKRPVAEIMIMNFLAVPMDQICNHAAKMRYMSGGATGVPLTIRAGYFGPVAGAQHSELLEGWFAQVPGLKVVIPSDPFEAKGLLLASIQDEDPVLFIESMTITQSLEVPERGEPIPLGKANIRRCGTDVTVIGYGHVVGMIEEAAANLTGEGISVEIVDPRTLVPLDAETIVQSVAKSRRAVVVTASIRSFGPGAEIAALIHEQLFSELLAPVKRVGGRAIPMPFSPALVMANYVTVPEIEAAIREVVK